MTEENKDLTEIVRALNNIHAELKTLNHTLSKSASAPVSSISPASEQSGPYGRPRLSGAAGRVAGKRPGPSRFDKGKSGGPSKGGKGFPKKPK